MRDSLHTHFNAPEMEGWKTFGSYSVGFTDLEWADPSILPLKAESPPPDKVGRASMQHSCLGSVLGACDM